jgi:RimJ/RimL family protein N-acetyltransferase
MRAVVKCGEYLWRPLTGSDADTAFVVKLRNEDRFARMFYTKQITPEMHKNFIAKADQRDEINWLIERNGQPMGLSALYHLDRENRKCECGRVAMLDPKLFHLNWMVTAFTAIEVVGLYRLYIETLEQNTIVARGLERIGMNKEGLMDGHIWNNGPVNVWLFSGTPILWSRVKPELCKRFNAEPQLISYEGWEIDHNDRPYMPRAKPISLEMRMS